MQNRDLVSQKSDLVQWTDQFVNIVDAHPQPWRITFAEAVVLIRRLTQPKLAPPRSVCLRLPTLAAASRRWWHP